LTSEHTRYPCDGDGRFGGAVVNHSAYLAARLRDRCLVRSLHNAIRAASRPPR